MEYEEYVKQGVKLVAPAVSGACPFAVNENEYNNEFYKVIDTKAYKKQYCFGSI